VPTYARLGQDSTRGYFSPTQSYDSIFSFFVRKKISTDVGHLTILTCDSRRLALFGCRSIFNRKGDNTRLGYCFNLPRQQWSLLNRFRTEQAILAASFDGLLSGSLPLLYYFKVITNLYLLSANKISEQGHCGACRRKWRLTHTDLCPCGDTQTICHTLSNPAVL